MSLLDKEPVKRAEKFLKNFDQSLEVLVLENSARTAQDAATALACDVGAIVKSLLFRTESTFILCLVAGDKRCSLNKLKKIKDKRDISMATPEDVKTQTGYTIGGVSPIGHNKKIKWSYEDRLNFFDNFLSNESYLKLSQIQILIGLQSFMDINDADYLFFDSISHFSNQTDTITYDYFESFINKDRFYIDDNNFNFDLWTKDNELYCHDKWHPNQEAHHLWGEKLLNYINK